MNGTEIYKRTAAYERDAVTIRLYAPEWKLLLAYDGQKSLSEVAQGVDTPLAEALRLTEKFLGQKWIEEQPITLDQYLKRTGKLPEKVSSVPPVAVSPAPKMQAAAPLPPPLAPPPVPTMAKKTTPIPPLPQTVPSEKLFHGPRSLRFGALIDYLISLADNRSLGQILVYRVFLRVPPALLQAEEIASIHLTGDSGQAKSVALQRAIANAVNEVTRRPLPDSVFAAA